MRLRSATSVLLTLVYCTAENNVPRWSKPDRDLGQGEWVPLNNERINQESARIPSAINPHQFNHALPQNPPTNQYTEDYQPKQILGAQSAPPRIAFLHSQGVNPQPTIQQPQLPSQQLLSQFLNEQIGQTNLPGFSRALLRKQPLLNSNYYTQEDTYSLEPNYNQVPDFKNAQYNFNSNTDFETTYSEVDKPIGNQNHGTIKTLQPTISNEHFINNFSSSLPNKKEEVQILYVPVEMLRQQEEARQEQARKTGKNIPLSDESHVRHQNHQGSQQFNTKEAKKFRHPIQPLKDQVPAHHLQAHEKILYPTPVAEVSTESKNAYKMPSYTSQRSTVPPRNNYFPNYNSDVNRAVPSGNKEQYVEETAIQDEISEYRNTVTRRTPQKDNRDRTHTTLPPPNQPPLSVFMESTSNNRIGDVLNLLKDSKTIPVLDSVGSDAPQVFVGPSNLNTPVGYIKYELPYLSSLNSNNAPPKLSQVPFFVAPLNFQPPPGFAKIPFPPPHIGSVVLSNVSNQQDDTFVPTPQSVERHTPNYKESFTIPADISSISPQLPSLINSLQEDEYLGSSSTESLTEPTEEPTLKYRRPTNSRRQNNRGSQRGYTSSGTTTRRPTSRQRKPSTRYSNQRINQNSEPKSNPSLDEQYSDNSRLNYNSNKKPELSAISSLPLEQSNKNHDFMSTEPHTIGHFPSNIGSNKQEERPLEPSRHHFSNNPMPVLSYSNDEIVHPNDGRSGAEYFQGRLHNVEQPSLHHYQDSRSSEPLTHATNTQSNHFHSAVPQNQQQQHSLKPVNNYEQQSYKEVNHNQGARIEDSAGSLPGYEELPYSKTIKNDRENPNHNLNYRIQDQPLEAERTINPGLLTTYQEQTPRFSSSDRGNHQTFIDVTTDKQRINGYLENFEDQNTTYISSDHIDTPENYGQTHPTNRPAYDVNNFPHTTEKANTHNPQNINYESRDESHKRITERPIPIRSRTRVRGRTHNQASYSQQTTPVNNYQYEDDQRISHLNQNSHNKTKVNSDSYEDRSPYTTTDQTPISPNKKYSQTRGRRPLRPTYSTSTAAYPTTTTTVAPAGTKYLIRTRRPTVAHTKLQTGRGRIRRPTTPTTTTTQATTTAEYPKTLPFQWRQPVANDEYALKDPSQDSDEYREPPQYQIGKTSEIVLQNNQNDRDVNYHQRRNYPKTNVATYEPEEGTVSTHKLYDTTEAQQYSPNYERTQKPHLSRNYETTLKSQYPREYERTSKPYNSREYETTPQTYLAKGYEETQKPHYVREYEATQKSHYTREYETTKKPYYPNEYETTQKSQYSRDYENPKTQTNNKYESPQNTQRNRNFEPVQKVQQYDEYETTKSPFTNDFATTHQPQNFREYEATNTQSYQEYETTKKPYVSQGEFKQRTHDSNPTRTSNHHHRRRPSAVTRGEIKNSKYNIKPETSTTKNTENDFWNQGVTIQQSQSYVYTPEDDQAHTEESPNLKKNVKSGALQNDYDDYYTYQDSGQYSSDQSPFPSNDQHVTYTKAKPNQEIGKANQYPEKTVYDKTISDQDKEQEMNDEKNILQQKSTSEQPVDINEKKNVEPRQTSVEDQETESVESEPVLPGSLKKSGKRRGTWVRVRVKKPKDVFETAESQRFSSVKDNSLIQDNMKTKVFHDAKLNLQKNEFKEDSQRITEETTTGVEDIYTKIPNENDFFTREEDKSEFTTAKYVYNNTENIDPGISSTVMDIQNESDEKVTTMSSNLVPESTTEFYNQETFRTSTTTEISLETEICYKGQCIKTKRKKNESDRNLPALI